ncbi:MAG: TraR/DksA C4-type zinc finger protein [Bacteroidia bacterium]|nr:TraR/DksA C4-type zinc finger protein [Bacteroidia bacterium]NND52901.1 TraR/DksA family transcriptional regulator [Flavobacteriaceae bacterium]
MESKDLKDIEQKIEAEIAATEAAILNYKELTKPIAPENAIGRISRMDAINNKTVNEAALRKAEQKLKNLKIALSNINDPDFGICGGCNTPIPIGRILLMPHSRFCVQCAR